MTELSCADGTVDLTWAEGSVYIIGFDTALPAWRRLLAPGGARVVTEIEWLTRTPSGRARAFWDAVYPLRDHAANTDAARVTGHRHRRPLAPARQRLGGPRTTPRSKSG